MLDSRERERVGPCGVRNDHVMAQRAKGLHVLVVRVSFDDHYSVSRFAKTTRNAEANVTTGHRLLIRRWLLDMVNDEHFDWGSSGLEPQTELLLHGRKDTWAIGVIAG